MCVANVGSLSRSPATATDLPNQRTNAAKHRSVMQITNVELEAKTSRVAPSRAAPLLLVDFVVCASDALSDDNELANIVMMRDGKYYAAPYKP